MVKSQEGSKFFSSRWGTVARLGITAIIVFWLYSIWTGTAGLNEQLNAASDRFSAISNLEVEYKIEVQEWKNVLLRSINRDTLEKNWRTYENQFQKVAAAAQEVIARNEARRIHEQMRIFVDAHAANHEKYAHGVEILIRNGYDPHPADAAVKGVDRPLLEQLAAANTDMQEERIRLNESLTAKTRTQLEESMFALAFIGLLAVWVPKY